MAINGVTSFGYPLDDFTFTYLLAAGITAADVGKAVTFDTVANTMKLTADNDPIVGRLATFEDRTVDGIKTGAVQRKFKEKLPAALSHGITVGQAVSGSAVAGLVKAATSQTEPKANRVVEVGTDFVVVERF